MYPQSFGLFSATFRSAGWFTITRELIGSSMLSQFQLSWTLNRKITTTNCIFLVCIHFVFHITSYFDSFIASWSVFILTSQEGLLLWIRGSESCVGRTGKQKQKCCYGVGLESTLYVSRYQTSVGKVCVVVIHPTSKLKSHISVQYLILNIMSQEESEQCLQ